MIALLNDREVAVRGVDIQPLGMFSYVSVDERVPAGNPIRKLRVLIDTILKEFDELLASRYEAGDRVSIPRRNGCRGSRCCRRSTACAASGCLNYNLLFRWFVDLNIDDPVWDRSTFSFSRDRLFDAEIAQRFFAHAVLLARLSELVSEERFSVDGTLLEAWASHRSCRRWQSAARGAVTRSMPRGRSGCAAGWLAKVTANRHVWPI